MSDHPDTQTLAKITAARTYEGTLPDEYLVAFPSIGAIIRHWAQETPEKIFLIHYNADGKRTEYSYRKVDAKTNQIANVLANHYGIKEGDRIATIAHNHADVVLTYLACWKLGVAVAPQNVAEDDERINYILRNSKAKLLIASHKYLDRAEQIVHGDSAVENVQAIIQLGGEPRQEYPQLLHQMEAESQQFQPSIPVTRETETLLVYTSGTTGPPKGVVLTHYNLMADARGISKWHGITSEDRTMCVLPIHHANGIIVTLMTPLYAGASTVLNRAYSSSTFWKRIAEENVQVVSVVPTLLQFSLEYADAAEAEGRSIWGDGVSRDDLANFRHIICGAGTLAVSLATAFEERFMIPVVHGYGLSETTCYSCFLPADLSWDEHRRWMKDYGYPSIGVPIEPNEMGIFDASGSGEQLGPGERGEICVRGHNVMKYYFRRPDANAETFKFGWFRTGDEGFYELDEQGRPYFFITGRLKELINRGGVKFSPFDIEEVLLDIPEVNVGLAIAFPNDYYGEEVGAYVVLKEGETLTEQAVIDYCRNRMTFQKSPKVVVFGEEIPVTSTGKYQRLRLRDLFEKWHDVQFRP